MLGVAATEPRVFRAAMATPPPKTPLSREIAALGDALRRLREAQGLTQEAAADRYGVKRQAWQNYEAGARQVLLRHDIQIGLAEAIGVTHQQLLDERDKVLGRGNESAPRRTPERNRTMEVPVRARARAGQRAPLAYDLSEPDSYFDAAWMFGDTSGTLRVAGDSMTGYVESGQLVIYDKTRWPRRGEGCVVETLDGELYIKEYVRQDDQNLVVSQRFPPTELTFPLSEVKGVFAVRLRGD